MRGPQLHAPRDGRPELEIAPKVRLPVLADVSDPVSASELAVFDSCEYRWRFEYVLRLRPLLEPIYFKIGKVVHSGLEAGYLSAAKTEGAANLDERVDAAALASEQAVDARLRRYEEHAEEEIRSPELRDRLITEAEETARLARWILPRYWRRYAEDFDRYRVAEVERRGTVPLGSGTRFLFVRDLVLLDRSDNPSAICADTKTTAQQPATLEKRVELDAQMTGYGYALAYELARRFDAWKDRDTGYLGPELDVPPRGVSVLYNVIRAWAPKTPKLTKDGTVSAAAIDTTPAIYRAALEAAGEPAFLVEAREKGGKKLEAAAKRWEKIQASQTERLASLVDASDSQFLRLEYTRTIAELNEWRRETEILAKRIQALRAAPELAVRSRWVCSAPFAKPCPFRMPCLEPGMPELYEGFRVSDPYERLKGSDDGSDETPQSGE